VALTEFSCARCGGTFAGEDRSPSAAEEVLCRQCRRDAALRNAAARASKIAAGAGALLTAFFTCLPGGG
jgi:hypothetical protein